MAGTLEKCVSCGATRKATPKNTPENPDFIKHVKIGRIQPCAQCGGSVCKRCAKQVRSDNDSPDAHCYIVCSEECAAATSVQRQISGEGYGNCEVCGKPAHESQLWHDFARKLEAVCPNCREDATQ